MESYMVEKGYGLGIIGVDWIISIIFFTSCIAKLTDKLTLFQDAIIGFLLSFIFLFFLGMPYIGTVIQLIISGLYSAFIYALIPYRNWVNGSKLWAISIAVLITLMIFGLHRIAAKSITGEVDDVFTVTKF